MDALEPFDYGELKEFSTAYLPGFFADIPDVSIEECSPRAEPAGGEHRHRRHGASSRRL